jgi:N-acetylneuraminic acid mutarotase
MSDVTRRLSPGEWDELIQNYRSSGLTAAQWCEAHGFKVHQLRWQINKRQKLNKDEQTIQWVPLPTDSATSLSPSITVKIGNAEISVSGGFNKELFAEVVHSLLTLC